MKDCRVTDVREKLLSHNEDYIYYKTDHHWTSEGAYLAYETWCDSTGMESTPLADLKKQVATKKFRGSLYSKILDADSAYDSIWTYGDTKQKAYGSDCSLTIDEKKQTDSCYDTAQLSQKDKYKYFSEIITERYRLYQTMPDIRIAICSSSRIRLQTPLCRLQQKTMDRLP